MASNLPRIGLQAVIEGATKFTKDLDAVNKRIDDATKKTKETTKSASPLSKELDKVGFSFDSVKQKVADFTGVNVNALDSIINIAEGFGVVGAAAAAAVVGVAALAAAFLALGNRGAPLQELGIAFDNIAASVGLTSQALLKDLRAASNGMVADFDLIKIANSALLGETGKLGVELGKKLPKLMEIARVASDATGKSLAETFDTLVEGVKRGTTRQLKSVGIVINATTANEEYAKSIHKSVAALTDEEQRVALLNATLEKGQAVLDQNSNAIETNADKMDRSQATITNIFDSLAIAVQPAFATVLDVVNRVLGAFQTLATGIAPIIGSIASIITDVLGGIFNTILDIVQPIIDVIGSFLPYISILFQGIANVVGGVVDAIRNVVGGIVNFLKDVAKRFFGLDLSNLGKNLFEGAAAAFGSFANGIISVANQLIFPAVIGIAQFIADFLIGFSPPKMGPLSKIDKGGENIMLAWLQGFAGVSLDPVDQVVAEVNAALGDIGRATLPMVDARIAELDKALLPFQNRLDIVKSQFEAIAEPAKAALDAIDRQVQEAEAALAQGDQGAAEWLRQLDAAREAIQGQLDTQQRLVDAQQIQLGLATAAQAQERALLNIRKAALEATQKKTKAEKAAGTVAGAERAGGGAAATPGAPENTGIMGTPTGPSALDLIGGQSGVDEAIAGIQDAFAGQIDTSQLALFQQNQGALQTQLDRIGSVDLGAKLADKFKGLTELFNPDNPDSIPAKIGGAISTLTADENTDGSIAHFFANVGPNVEAALSGLGPTLAAQFDPNIKGSPANIIVDAVRTLTGDDATADSLASFFSQLPENVSNAASGLFDQLQTNVFDPVKNFLTGEGEGTLSAIIDGAINFFAQFPSRVVETLKSFGLAVYTAVVLPVISVVNSLIETIETTIKNLVNSIASFLYNAADTLSGILDTSGIRNVANDITTKANAISFGRISTAVPSFLQPTPPGAARGGLFSPGRLRVGEQGPETLFNASKVGVLPADLTRVIEGIGSMMAQPAPMMMPGNTYNESSSVYNFNGVQSDNDARRRYNALRAGMR